MKEIGDFIADLALYGLEKIGLYYSSYRGFVADNKDPLGYNRIRISVPEIYGEDVPSFWAWPKGNFSGKNYGVQLLPQVNDLVWVSFEKGNKNKPLWQHGYFGKGEKPTDFESEKVIGLITPRQNKILINDETGEVTLISNKGKLIKIDSKIYLGAENYKPIAFGDTTKDKLENLINILAEAKVMTSLGPQPLMPDTLLELQQLKESLPEILSETSFTE